MKHQDNDDWDKGEIITDDAMDDAEDRNKIDDDIYTDRDSNTLDKLQ